ncbi:hypothetical protein AZI86_05210 [Bdellovibrio bacteriovorus]|uniref:Uncharacterized protein n=1 Tax=Bdellovibrio bacteriovorus TaxID=959 RepID=A0A150WQ04_BDEBC|nr:hypothetical protein [Bdellovibrio bacteriovorus]KYG66446.1 hypothetical protein AZI86_05210 [Bdellovibrio bacteriovorus]
MKNLMFVFAMLTSVVFVNHAQAQQLELPFKSADQVLLSTMPGDANARYINNVSSLPSKVVKAFDQVDLPFEMGDGYYNYRAGAFYEVTDNGVVVGYIEANLMTYTEDPGFYLGLAFINAKGLRLEIDPNYGEFTLDELPSELHPDPDYE